MTTTPADALELILDALAEGDHATADAIAAMSPEELAEAVKDAGDGRAVAEDEHGQPPPGSTADTE